MVTLVERRADEVVHARVGDDECLGRRAFDIEHAGQKHTGIADKAASGLEEDFQAERLKQRHDCFRIVVESDALAAVLLGALPPIGRTAIQRAAIDDADAAADAEELDTVERLQLLHDRDQFSECLDERFGFEDLRSDVRLDAADLQVRQFGRFRVDTEDAVDADAELVVALARRNVFVRLRIHVGIHAQGHRGFLAHGAGHLVDELQLHLGFDVEGIDALLEGVCDFLPRLAHAGKGARVGASARFDHAEKFTARDNVKTRALPRQQVEHGEVRVRFHGETNPVIETGQRLVQAAVMITDRLCAIDVEGRAVLRGQTLEGDALAIQFAVTVGKLVHTPIGPACSAGRLVSRCHGMPAECSGRASSVRVQR